MKIRIGNVGGNLKKLVIIGRSIDSFRKNIEISRFSGENRSIAVACEKKIFSYRNFSIFGFVIRWKLVQIETGEPTKAGLYRTTVDSCRFSRKNIFHIEISRSRGGDCRSHENQYKSKKGTRKALKYWKSVDSLIDFFELLTNTPLLFLTLLDFRDVARLAYYKARRDARLP
jgi:hypothetical protein